MYYYGIIMVIFPILLGFGSLDTHGFTFPRNFVERKRSSFLVRHEALGSNELSQDHPNDVSRRRSLLIGASTLVSAFSFGQVARADQNAIETISGINSSSIPQRENLLNLLSQEKPDESEVKNAIEQLVTFDPSNGKGAASSEVDGTWELLYSLNTEKFSPLLGLPKPIRPKSIQLLGDDAANLLGEGGRAVQILDFPFPVSYILSSGAVPATPSTFEIYPPFRFDVALGGLSNAKNRLHVLDTGDEAGFRALNGRDGEAQMASRNMYLQRYLETSGKKGDLRISEVVAGDPVIVGSVFIHQRL
mmetsp:Transcript_6615/g.9544  ORF Transcript_6615/g.9544 Transcript_6615/m.9544 type:complete len:304 (+) Transcript_6615:83-994(+)